MLFLKPSCTFSNIQYTCILYLIVNNCIVMFCMVKIFFVLDCIYTIENVYFFLRNIYLEVISLASICH